MPTRCTFEHVAGSISRPCNLKIVKLRLWGPDPAGARPGRPGCGGHASDTGVDGTGGGVFFVYGSCYLLLLLLLLRSAAAAAAALRLVLRRAAPPCSPAPWRALTPPRRSTKRVGVGIGWVAYIRKNNVRNYFFVRTEK